MIFYIDFENTGSVGMCGIELLSEDDTAVIFYSESKCRATFSLVRKLLETKAKLEFAEVTITAPNALDFQLSSRLGCDASLHPGEQLMIISEDKGYKAVVLYWEGRNVRVEQHTSIYSAVRGDEYNESGKRSSADPEQIKDSLVICPECADKTVEIINKTSSKEEIYKKLVESFGEDKASYIYNSVKYMLTDKRNTGPVVKKSTVAGRLRQYSDDADIVAEIINSCVTRSEVRMTLEKELGADRGKAVFNLIRPIIVSKKPGSVYGTMRIPEQAAVSPPEDEQTAFSELVPESEPDYEAYEDETETEAAALADASADDNTKKIIDGIFEKYKTKLGVKKAIIRAFGEETGEDIIKSVAPRLKDKKGKDRSPLVAENNS